LRPPEPNAHAIEVADNGKAGNDCSYDNRDGNRRERNEHIPLIPLTDLGGKRPTRLHPRRIAAKERHLTI
jgi:hypothetical protein